jgi:hypothetical protein
VALEEFIVLHQVKADAIDAMGGVDDGLDLRLASLEGIEKGERNGSIVLGGAIAHLVESLPKGRVAAFGDLAHAVRMIARTVGDGVKAGKGPDPSASSGQALGGAVKTVGGTETSQVSGCVHIP